MRCAIIVILMFCSYAVSAQADSISKLENELASKKDTARINTLNKLASAFLIASDLDKSKNYAQSALALSVKLDYWEGEIKSRGYLGYIFQRQGNYVKSGEYIKKAIVLAENVKDKNLLASANNSMFILLYTMGQYDSAAVYTNRSLEIAGKTNNVPLIARGNENLGMVSGIKGNHVLGIGYFIKSMDAYELLEDNNGVARLMGHIGHTFELAGNYEESLKYLLGAYDLQFKNGDKNTAGWTLLNIGVTYSRMGKDSLRLEYYKKALKAAEEVTDSRLKLASLDNIGGWYSKQKDFQKSNEYLQQAYNLSENSGYNSRTVYITGNIAENYYLSGDLDKAEEFGLKHLEFAKKDKEVSEQKVAYSILSQIYAAQSQYQKGHEALAAYIKLNDSIFNQQKSEQVERLRTEYETEKKEQEIQVLEQQKLTAEFRRNTYLAAGLLSATLLFLLYNQQRQKSKKNRLLFEKEHEVAVMKSNFFSNISHEFRTPLTLILGPIEIIRDTLKNPKMLYHLDTMERNASRLLSLINQLLDLSKIESGSSKLQIEEKDLMAIIKGVTMSFQSKAEEKQIRLEVKSEVELLPAFFDQDKIETILINLIANSLNFTPEQGHIKVLVETKSRTKYCKIVVQDNGKGIPKEDLNTIFNRFYQSDNQRDGAYEGSGIGLALTKELVELHGGSINVSSKEGEGTEITFLLPIDRSNYSENELTKINQKEAPETTAVLLEKNKDHEDNTGTKVSEDSVPILLLIEDNVDVMKYVKEILFDSYHVLEAMDGKIGIEMAIENIPDLIISDVMMPRKNGYEVCETLKQDERTSHVPIILLTAKAALDDKMKGLKTRADAYLTKPFVPKELLVRVQNLINSRKHLREKYKRELILKPSEVTVNSIDEKFLMKVMKVVEENLDDEHFNMDKLGKGVGMSRSQIHRKLHALTNQSATQFIRSYRLDRAMDLIKKNAGSISEIAYMVGFSDPSYFSKSFHEQFNITPSDAKDTPA